MHRHKFIANIHHSRRSSAFARPDIYRTISLGVFAILRVYFHHDIVQLLNKSDNGNNTARNERQRRKFTIY